METKIQFFLKLTFFGQKEETKINIWYNYDKKKRKILTKTIIYILSFDSFKLKVQFKFHTI